jgi:hypothetical protein
MDRPTMDRPTTDRQAIVDEASTTVISGSALSRRARNTLLTVHIAASVALLGDVLGLAAVTLRARGADDPVAAEAAYEIMSMFSLTFGIPLSFTALLSGIALGLGTRWGVLRYPWVIAKLGLILVVILVGALVVGPAEGTLLSDSVSDSGRSAALTRALVGETVQIAALVTSVGLSVFKPGRRRADRGVGATGTSRPVEGDRRVAVGTGT